MNRMKKERKKKLIQHNVTYKKLKLKKERENVVDSCKDTIRNES